MNAHEYMRRFLFTEAEKRFLDDVPMASLITGTYYGFYASGRKKKIGDERTPFSIKKADKVHRKVEEILEKIRSEKFPHLPSRIGAKMVCPTVSAAKFWASSSSRHYVYMVECTGKMVMLNSEIYTVLVGEVQKIIAPFEYQKRWAKRPIESTYSTAEYYWEQDGAGNDDYREILVEGSVKVVEEIM